METALKRFATLPVSVRRPTVGPPWEVGGTRSAYPRSASTRAYPTAPPTVIIPNAR